MSEVALQMKPVTDAVEKFNAWRLRIWNDNGGPPGYLQTRRDEDDESKRQIKDDLKNQNEKLEPLVAFVEEQRLNKERLTKRWEFWWPILKWAGGGIGTASLALVVWIGPKFVSFAGIVYQTWLRDHPIAAQQIKTVGADTNMALPSQKTNRPQDAGSTMLPNH